MSRVIPFQSHNFSVRAVEIDGAPFFVGKDVADALGYADTKNAIKQHCKGVAKHHPLQTLGGMQEARVISEPDMLRLIVNSTLPAAERFEHWVFEEVLPSIRKTGRYSARDQAPAAPRTQAELLLANVQVLVDMERQQAQHGQALLALGSQVDRIEQAMTVMSTRPSNAEGITHIRERIGKLHGLSGRIVDEVLRQSPYAPKPAGVVRNDNQNAGGSTYSVFWRKDVTTTFARFVAESQPVTATQCTHPFIEGRFKLVKPREGRCNA